VKEGIWNGGVFKYAKKPSPMKWLKETNNCPKVDRKRATLEGAFLQDANHQGPNLFKANLGLANLWKANFQRASLKGAGLYYTNLQGDKLDAESIKIAKTSGAINVPKTSPPTVIANKSSTKERSLPPCKGSLASNQDSVKSQDNVKCWTDCIDTVIATEETKYVGQWKAVFILNQANSGC